MTPKTEEIVARVELARNELLASAHGLGEAALAYRPVSGGWSIADIFHHLALADEACAKLMALMLRNVQDTSPGPGPGPDPDPNASVIRSVDDLVVRADGETFSAPEIVRPKSTIAVSESLSRLQVSRLKILTRFEALSAFDLSGVTYRHPLFGELNTYQWVLVTGWHESRHTRQIERVKAEPGFPKG